MWLKTLSNIKEKELTAATIMESAILRMIVFASRRRKLVKNTAGAIWTAKTYSLAVFALETARRLISAFVCKEDENAALQYVFLAFAILTRDK